LTYRLAVAGIFHETNTYAVQCTGPTTFEQFEIYRGQSILERHRGVRDQLGGILAGADYYGFTVVPVYDALAYPSGTIAAEAYETLKSELLAALAAELPVDAIALSVHGAGTVDGTDDLEADLARGIRGLVGPEVPIVAVLDLHGNISDEMANLYDLMLGVHLYPHTDFYERGFEVIGLLARLLKGEINPIIHVEHIPMLLPTSTTDPGAPAAAMNDVCAAIAEMPGILDCTVFHGFPYTDVPGVGMTVVCTTDGDGDRVVARRSARKVATWIWEHREDFRPESQTPELALKLALQTVGGPVVINDTADNSGGGAPGDGTHVLRAFLEADLDNAVFGSIFDPSVADTAHLAGVGATIRVSLGGKHDAMHGKPLKITAYVKCLTDGKIALTSPMGAGLKLDMGRCARLVVGGLDIVVASSPVQTIDPSIFLLHGIDVKTYRIVGLKSSHHFRAGFRDLASAIVTADSPGLTSLRAELFEHTRLASPMWPLDQSATYAGD
jgi:microcystin degradation protein MlrC